MFILVKQFNLITDSKGKRINDRVLSKQLIRTKVNYDIEKYLKLLLSAADTLLGVFGHALERIRDLILYHEKQLILNLTMPSVLLEIFPFDVNHLFGALMRKLNAVLFAK